MHIPRAPPKYRGRGRGRDFSELHSCSGEGGGRTCNLRMRRNICRAWSNRLQSTLSNLSYLLLYLHIDNDGALQSVIVWFRRFPYAFLILFVMFWFTLWSFEIHTLISVLSVLLFSFCHSHSFWSGHEHKHNIRSHIFRVRT